MVAVSALQAPARINSYTPLREYVFKGRPTIVLVIVHGERVLFVQSAQSGDWILPQGSIQKGDSYLRDAVLRVGMEDLDLTDVSLSARGKIAHLYDCVNPIPLDRDAGCSHKHLVFASVPVCRKDWVKLTGTYKKSAWAHSFGEILALMGDRAEERSVKFLGTCTAINRLWEEGVLTWRCELLELD